jgi:hypothetical protein
MIDFLTAVIFLKIYRKKICFLTKANFSTMDNPGSPKNMQI